MPEDIQDPYFGNDTATFGDRVEAARQNAGLSQSDLAKRLGVKLKTVRNWEEDLSEPRANKLSMIAGITNVSVMWLLTGEGHGVDAPYTSTVSEDAQSILSDLHNTHVEMGRLADRVRALEGRLTEVLARV